MKPSDLSSLARLVGKVKKPFGHTRLSTVSGSDHEGKSYDEMMRIRKERIYPSMVTFYKEPLLVEKGEMQYLFDHKGRKYLDMFGGIVTVSVGHCHPEVNAALREQMEKIWHTTSIYMTPPIHDYAQKLTDLLPHPLKVCFFVNSGTEANDLAMMLARLYTKNHDIMSLRNGYHGMSSSAMGITNMSTWKQPGVHGFGIHRVKNTKTIQNRL